jgi:hypothetical protein
MKRTIIKTRFGALPVLILVLALNLISCGDNDIGDPVIANDCDAGKMPVARSGFSIQDGSGAQMARDICAGVGRVIAAGSGQGNRIVIAFEETHASRAGQIEIAIMLLRLHNRYKLRQVSLEGAIVGDPALSPAWFHELTADPNSKRTGQQLAVSMLKEGEINSGEFSSLVWPDVQVKGNEKAEEYNVELSDRAASSVNHYLIGMVENSLTQSTISQINQLSREGKNKEAAALLFGSDPWVKEHYDKLTDKGNITSVEESVKILQEIEARAKSSGTTIKPEDQSGLQDMIKFFRTAAHRSCTMVANTLAMCDQSPGMPVGLIIGAAHTPGVIELLKAGDASFAIISPDSLTNGSESGTLTTAAYKRKNAKKSVDPAGYLGAYLDRRHKPPVIIGQTWYKTKSEIGVLASAMAAAAAGGETPPFNSLRGKLKSFHNIVVDSSSFDLIRKGDEVWAICIIQADTGAGKVKLCVGGAKQPPPPGGTNNPRVTDSDKERDPNEGLEQLLLQALAKAKQEAQEDEEKPNPGPAVAVVTQLTTDTKIGIAQSVDVLKSVITK